MIAVGLQKDYLVPLYPVNPLSLHRYAQDLKGNSQMFFQMQHV